VTIKEEWVDHCIELACTPAHFYSGCRKILRNQQLLYDSWDESMVMADAGYTKSKMTMLTKNYLHEESRAVAVQLWDRRREQAKYGSVSFTTFNHFVKGKGTVEEIAAKGSKRASVFGPCLQSVIITWLRKDRCEVCVTYRTTEAFKKYPADLVFLQELLRPFNFDGMKVDLSFYFANVTAHPMYFITVLPHLKNPIKALERIKLNDPFFWAWCLKWSARYICEEHSRGIQKFSQALRVKKDANDRLDPAVLKALQDYFLANHPGHRNEYTAPEEDDE
jgi:hypothetical protein